MSTAILTFQVAPGQDIEFPLNGDSVTLGRDPSNAIVIQNSWISSNHARFTRRAEGAFEIHDLDSQNGVEVNGKRVVRCLLRDGDKVAFGQVEARYIIPESDASREAKTASIPVGKNTGMQHTLRGGNRAELENSLDHLRDQKAKLTAEVEKLDSIKKKLSTAAKDEGAIESLQNELDTLHKDIAEATALRDEITTESAESKKLLSNLTEETSAASAAKAALSEAIAAKDRTEKALKAIDAKVHASENLRDSLVGEIESLEKKQKTLVEAVATKKEENASLKEQSETLESALATLKADATKEKASHETAEKSLAALHEQIASAEATSKEAKDVQADLTALHVQKTSLENEVATLEETVSSLADDAKKAEKLRSEIEASENALAELTPQKAILEETATKVALAMTELSTAKSESETIEKALTTSREEITSLESATAEARTTQEEIEKNTASLKARVAELEDHKETLEAAQDLEWGTVHVLSKNLIRRIDLLDDLLKYVRTEGKDKSIIDQLVALREALLDILREHSVEAFHFPEGTPIDLDTRKRIVIIGGVEEAGTSGGDGKAIASTVRPGYFCSNGNIGSETLLRKAEVKIA